MMAPTWWRAIGGPSAVSRWSGVFSVVLLIPSAVWTAAYSSLSIPTAILVEVFGAVVALALLWLAHATWLAPTRTVGGHRTPVALLTFFAVGLVRLFVMYASRAMMGIEQPWSPWQALITGGVYSVVVLSIVAIVVDSIRGHADAMATLRQADESLARARTLDMAEAERLHRAYAEEALREVREGIRDLTAEQDTTSLAVGLQRMAEQVAREASHSLSRGEVVTQAITVPRGNVSALDVARQIRPAAPVLGPIGFEALVFTAVFRDLGGTIAVVNAAVATAVLVIGNLMLCALAQRWWPPRGRLVLLALSYFFIGLAAVVVVGTVVTLLRGQTPALWVGAVSYAVFMLFFSAIASLRRGQRELEDSVAESVAGQAEELARVRALVGDQQARLAHLLHGGLQAELTAAAVTLTNQREPADRARDPGLVIDNLLAEIERQEGLVEGHQPSPEWDDVIDTWGMALDLRAECDASARERLAMDTELRGRVIDVLSEALTNVVRHSRERRADVTLTLDGDGGVLMQVSNPGQLMTGDLGLGSREMDERCRRWSRTQEEAMVVLRASFGSTVGTVG